MRCQYRGFKWRGGFGNPGRVRPVRVERGECMRWQGGSLSCSWKRTLSIEFCRADTKWRWLKQAKAKEISLRDTMSYVRCNWIPTRKMEMGRVQIGREETWNAIARIGKIRRANEKRNSKDRSKWKWVCFGLARVVLPRDKQKRAQRGIGA